MNRRVFLKSIGITAAIAAGVMTSYYLYLTTSIKREESGEITIIDTRGREISLPYPIKSCVVTDDSLAEIVQILGAEDKIVGIEDSIRRRGYFPKIADRPIIGNQWRGLNYELIAELKPDVVIMYGRVAPAEQALKKLEEINVKAICIDPALVNGYRVKSIEILGKILGREEKAREFLAWREKLLNQLENNLSDLKRKATAYIAMGFGRLEEGKLPLRTWGKKFAHNVTIEEWAKIRNIASEICERVGEVELEWIINQNPDMFIIVVWSGGVKWDLTGYLVTDSSIPENYVKQLKSNKLLKMTKPIKNNKIFLIDHLLTGTRAEIGATYLAKAAYPERMEGVEPEEIHREYFEKWLRVKYQGIWFYP